MEARMQPTPRCRARRDGRRCWRSASRRTKAGVPHRTLELVHLRASQINGCSVCVDMHAKDAQAGRRDRRADLRRRRLARGAVLHRRRAGRAGADRVRDPPGRPARPGARRDLGRGRPHYDEEELAALVVDIASDQRSGTGSTPPPARSPAPGPADPTARSRREVVDRRAHRSWWPAKLASTHAVISLPCRPRRRGRRPGRRR